MENIKYYIALFFAHIFVSAIISIILSIICMMFYNYESIKEINIRVVIGIFSIVAAIYLFKKGYVFLIPMDKER